MLQMQKVIALCTAHLQNPEILESVQAFLIEAKKRGYAVLTFNSDVDASDSSACDMKSYSVYDLIPYGIVDAVVIMAETIHNQIVADSICSAAAAVRIPVLSYDGILREYPSVYCYTNQSFTDLLDHMLTVHNCRKIDLLTGEHGSYASEKMVAAYQDVLRASGIPFDASRVEYGEYSEKSASEAAERLIAKDVPDAIVCMDDTMAMACCTVLRRHSLRVPEDVLVTGMGGIVREQTHSPRLTTCVKDYASMTKVLFDTADLLIAGENVQLMCEIPAILRTSESCGCAVKEQRDMNDAINYLHNCIQVTVRQEANESRILGTLMRREHSTVIDYLDVLADHLSDHSYLCLRDCIAPDSSENILANFADSSELMSTVTVSRKEKRYAITPRAKLVPELETALFRNGYLVLTSIFFQQETYGYYAYYGSRLKEDCFKLPKFLHTAGNVIGASLNAARLLAMNERILTARIRDSLTGMLNLNGGMRTLSEQIQSGTQAENRLIMVVVGLKNLRQINSIFGHLEGDQALLGLSSAINDCIDSDVVAARIGGDEFMIAYFSSNLHADNSDALVSVLMKRLHSYNQVSGKSYSLDTAIGKVSAQVTPDLSLEGMLNEAIELKDAKRTANHREDGHVPYASLQDQLAKQVEQILDKNLLTYYFQPIVSGRTGKIYAYEALMRTTGEYKISPLTVLQYATMMGRLYEVEWLTYCNVLRHIRENEAKFRDMKIFINSIPGHFITDSDFARLRDLYSDLLPMLVVEFTEQAETDGEELKLMQNRCAVNGMEIAVDDYGTGYSNITNLLRYSPNYVKIDRSLISNIHEEPKKQHFVTNIIEFAHANGFQALAEGVETLEEMRAAIRFGVDLIQGNFTAKPEAVPPAQIPPGTVAVIQKISSEAAKQFVRKTYMPNHRQMVKLSKLTAENYTDIFIAHPYVELIGDFDVTAGVAIKFKENTSSHLVLQDIHLSATQPAPCIVLGKNSNVTLEFRGDNRMDHGGIWVPEGANLHIIGRGNLSISVNDARSSAIGCDVDSCFGNIAVDLAGCLQITTNGDQCIGIGGGTARGQKISVCGTKLFFQTSGVESIAIGAECGDCDITLTGCSVNLECRIASGLAVGIAHGTPTISLNTVDLEMNGSGKTIAVIGSLHGGALISAKDCDVKTDIKAQNVTIIGSDDGAPQIKIKQSSIDITCEGTRVLDVGSVTKDADLTVADTTIRLNVSCGNMMHLAAAENKRLCTGLTEDLNVNV
ncbi:MAG: EAL domain-containing protein [Oscillospiraceae bacterium]|nr:EAL domain-containing protein [Oscillospiraceae bacterium]